MNIRKHYFQTADTNLNGSILISILLSSIMTISMVFSWNLPFFVTTIPFLTIILQHYYSYLLFKHHGEKSQIPVSKYTHCDFLAHNVLLLGFAPAPAVRILFFTPDGRLAGEMKEEKVNKWRWILPTFFDKRIKKQIGLYDTQGKVVARITTGEKGIKVLNHTKETTAFYIPQKIAYVLNEKNAGKLLYKRGSYINEEFKLLNEQGFVASRIQNGWMPLEWSHTFKEANTPVLTFDFHATKSERLATMAILVHQFSYYNH